MQKEYLFFSRGFLHYNNMVTATSVQDASWGSSNTFSSDVVWGESDNNRQTCDAIELPAASPEGRIGDLPLRVRRRTCDLYRSRPVGSSRPLSVFQRSHQRRVSI